MPKNDDLKNRLDELFSISPDQEVLEKAGELEEKPREDYKKGLTKEAGFILEIGKKTKNNPPLPEFLDWLIHQIPTVFRNPKEYLVAIEYEKKIYGSQEAIDSSSKNLNETYALGDNLGRMYITNTQLREFNEFEKATITEISTLVSEYIENQRLIQQIIRNKKLQEIASRVRSSMDTATIMRIAVQELGNSLGRKTFIRLGNIDQMTKYENEGFEDIGEFTEGGR